MNYATIKWTDIANGEGVRISLFVSGCTRRCKDCFNAVAWDFSYGKPFDESVRESIYEGLKADYIAGLSLLGGEPFHPKNRPELARLLEKIKKTFPEKDIWCYTGCVLETDLLTDSPYRCDATDALLREIDVLVDGPFVEEQKSLQLAFRGSANQRILRKKNGVFTEANQ